MKLVVTKYKCTKNIYTKYGIENPKADSFGALYNMQEQKEVVPMRQKKNSQAVKKVSSPSRRPWCKKM